ncbi:MAG: hypothetical protein GY708_10335 [Actinomycetia bacterium]|nr:hypothetical protein [Actinomycetes bacterium]
MKLVLTHYVDSTPENVENGLDSAIVHGLDTAEEFATEQRGETIIETTATGRRVHQGLADLNGSEVRVSSLHQLTRLEITVPWSDSDAGTPKLWAASRFASSVADAFLVAA